MDTLFKHPDLAFDGLLCRYDATVAYDRATNADLHQATVSAELIVGGQPDQVVSESRSFESEDVTDINHAQLRLGQFFLLTSTSTSFTIYLRFKSPQQEEEMFWEAKFYYQESAEDKYTWDIVGNTPLWKMFSVSLEVHYLESNEQDRRIDIYHENEVTSLAVRSSADGLGISLEREKRYTHNLLDLPPSEERTKALHWNSSYLFGLYNTTRDVHYLDLVVQLMRSVSTSARDHAHCRCDVITLCLALFHRCTLPQGDVFVAEAFDVLKKLEGVLPKGGAPMSLLEPPFKVALQQNRADYAGIVFRVLASPLCAVAAELESDTVFTTVSSAFQIVYRFPELAEREEAITIADAFLRFISVRGPDYYGFFLLCVAEVYLSHCERSKTQGVYDMAIATIEKGRVYLDTHRPPSTREKQMAPKFFVTAIRFLYDRCFQSEEQVDQPSVPRMFAFLTWSTAYAESQLDDFREMRNLLPLVTACVLKEWWQMHRRLEVKRLPDFERNKIKRGINDLVRAIYNQSLGLILKDNEIEFLQKQMECLWSLLPKPFEADTITLYFSPASLNPHDDIKQTMQAVVKHSLSTKLQDAVTLLRAIIAASISRTFGFSDTLGAYQLIMSNSEYWASMSIRIEDRYNTNPAFMPVSSDAISYVLSSDLHHNLALEWADQSSSTIWSQLLRLHTSFAENTFSPTLAKELSEVSSELIQAQVATGDSDEYYSSYHLAQCSFRWEKAIEEARKIPGLDRFMQPKTFSEIECLASALGGPVVYFNINRYSCDALCVLPGLGEVMHIPLPELDLHQVTRVAHWFFHLLRGKGNLREDLQYERKGKLVPVPGLLAPVNPAWYIPFPTVLEYLWVAVVKPILGALGIQRSTSESARDLPRIWWCPSGPLSSLPLHAAGLYNSPTDENILDYAVSSYIPSASVISRITRPPPTPQSPGFLAIGNPQGCGLFGTLEDLCVVRKRVINMPLTELVGAGATVEATMKELATTSWVHFACHGVQGRGSAMESALILADRARLTLAEITKLSLPQAQFAFLSACRTAEGRDLNPNESAHLTAGMLVAGFRSVIGTMWNIKDDYAPEVADHVYGKLFEGNQTPDYRYAAFALHDAVRTLRREKNRDFSVWVPFMHAGA